MAFNNEFTQVENTWLPVGANRPNTFTAQNVFKAPTTIDAGVVFQGTGTISAIPTVDANAIAVFQGTEAVVSHVLFASSGQPNHVYFRRNNGTYAVPTAIANNDVLGSVQWQGRGATTFGSTIQAQVRAVANETFTDSAKGTSLQFFTTTAGANSTTLSLTIIGGFASFAGQVIGTDFQLSNSVGNTRTIFFRTSSSTRWTILANGNAESGSNAGSNFEITRWSDAQVSLGHIMQATRSTGDITFNAGGGTSTFASSVRSAELQISQASGNNRFLYWQTSGSARWGWYTNNGAESGSNTGSDLLLARYSDAGGLLAGAVITISRANGNITMNGGGGKTTFAGNAINIATAQSPANSAAAGAVGDIAWDDNYLYVRQSSGWRRIALGAAF